MFKFKRKDKPKRFKRIVQETSSATTIPKKMTATPLVKNNGGNGNGKGNTWLTPSQKMFADKWCVNRNALRAYKDAYPNVKKDATAGVCGNQLLKTPKVAAYVKKRIDRIAKKAEIDTEWVLKRYKLLTDYCIDDFFNDDGTMKPFSEIPRDKLYAIGGFKQSKRTLTTRDKVVVTNAIKEFDLPKKKDVLDSIGRHLGMFEKDNEQGRSITPVQINVSLEA